MPSIRRKQLRQQWGDLHRNQLKRGAIAGEVMRIPCRQREPQGEDFGAGTMALAAQAWADLKDELLATVSDPTELWAYRRFEIEQPSLD
jgi:hypothetical protein